MRHLSLIAFFVFFNAALSLSSQNDYNGSLRSASSYATSSVLSTGKWVKIRVKETGVYKITHEDLKGWGFENPENVQLHGYGGWILDERITIPRIDDLPQIPVWVEKKGTKFSSGDYILFYAKGAIKWEYDSSKSEITHTNNPYSDYGYYFLTESSLPTLKIQSETGNYTDFSKTLDYFNDYCLHEKNMVNIVESGREFYGESFMENLTQTFSFDLSGVRAGASSRISVDFIAKTATITPLKVSVNGINNVLSGNVPAYPSADNAYTNATTVYLTNTFSGVKSGKNDVIVTYGASGHLNAHLNYIRLNYSRDLKLYPDKSYLLFRNMESITNNVKYSIEGYSDNFKVWDVTNACEVKKVNTTIESAKTSFISQKSSTLKEYALVDVSKDNFLKPEFFKLVEKQDLHALSQNDMVIITVPAFLSEAKRLADFHYQQDGLITHVVTAEQIFNEFSSGTPDASAFRWFMKMFYDKGKKSGLELPQYLLLFGKGVFDNKGIISELDKNNLLTYQSENSIHRISSYTTDDYFGFLDDNENKDYDANKIKIDVYKVNLSIGRIPAKTEIEARNAVDKVIKYTVDNINDTWKNTVCFVSDNGDDYLHIDQTDSLTREYLGVRNKEFIVNKIYLETHKAVSSKFPEAEKDLVNKIENGTLFVNYTGHASPGNLSKSSLFNKTHILNLKNDKYPLFITATCEFSRFDRTFVSAGEDLILKPNAGSIALFSTTRVVNSTPNFKINNAINNYIFDKNLRLGDVLKQAKRSLSPDLNKLSYAMLGDPAVRLALPQQKIQITSVNDKSIDNIETLSAGSSVKITGKVISSGNDVDTNFSGTIYLNLYDSENILYTFPKKKTVSGTTTSVNMNIYDQTRALFIGKGVVDKGIFSISFIMPKNLNYSNDFGKINLYATSNDEKKDAHGYFENFKVGGVSDSPAMNDKNPPLITSMYIGNSNFNNGNAVANQSVLVLEVQDAESGISVSGTGIGHDPMLKINNSPTLTYNLKTYFDGDLSDTKQGKFTFKLPSLQAGKHSLTVKVWDIMNNSSEKKIDFEIKEEKIAVLAVPDFSEKVVTFLTENTTARNDDVIMTIEVYDATGKEIWRNSRESNINLLCAYPSKWNISDGQIKPGVYSYKTTITSTVNNPIISVQPLIINK